MRINKLLLALAFLMLFTPVSSLGLAIEKPTNSTYTTSINIPIEYLVADTNGTCEYVLDGNLHNLPLCEASKFNVNYDGAYTLELYAYNGTDAANENVTFTVDRTSEFEQGKPYLASFAIAVLIAAAFFCLVLNFTIKYETLPILKGVIIFAGISCFMTAGFSTLLVVNEYLKFTALADNLATLGYVLASLTIFISVYLFLMFLRTILANIRKKY